MLTAFLYYLSIVAMVCTATAAVLLARRRPDHRPFAVFMVLEADRRSERFLRAHPPRHGFWGTLVTLAGACSW